MPTARPEELMVQPPYPPPGRSGPEEGSDEPTQQIGPGPQREPTRRLPQPGQHASPPSWGSPDPSAPRQYGPPAQYPPPGHYGPPGQFGPPGQYPAPGPYHPPPGQYGPPPGQYPPPGPYGPPDLAGQPVFGQPWGAPGGPQEPRQRNRRTGIALLVAGVLALVVVGVALFLVFGNDPGGTAAGERQTSSGDSDLPAATREPDGLGEDRALDELAQSCYEGDMSSCDRLYDRSEAGSDYETYGDTCAGRQPSGTFVYCTETFPEN